MLRVGSKCSSAWTWSGIRRKIRQYQTPSACRRVTASKIKPAWRVMESAPRWARQMVMKNNASSGGMPKGVSWGRFLRPMSTRRRLLQVDEPGELQVGQPGRAGSPNPPRAEEKSGTSAMRPFHVRGRGGLAEPAGPATSPEKIPRRRGRGKMARSWSRGILSRPSGRRSGRRIFSSCRGPLFPVDGACR